MARAVAEPILRAGDDAHLPFFVYGTLQTGFRNHDNVVRGRLEAVLPARLSHALLFHFDIGFPGMYTTKDEAASVRGQLLYVPADAYAAVLIELDALESYSGPGAADNMYERVIVDVHVDARDAPVRAYTYVCLLDLNAVVHTRVVDGDWRAFMAAHALQDAADDWSRTLSQAACVVTTTTMSSADHSSGTPHRPVTSTSVTAQAIGGLEYQ